METSVAIILKRCESIPTAENYIGVDKGALTLARNGKRMLLAIGDFDSVEESDLAYIKEYSDTLLQLNPIKDDTDSEAAVMYAIEKGYQKIHLYGGLGGRLDHAMINLRLVSRFPETVYLHDQNNFIYSLAEGVHSIDKRDYTYISFFTEDKATISLEGLKYPLDKQQLTNKDTYTTSNEILEDRGIVTVHAGKVTVIQSKDA
ncbi:thiamine diphosphokinase [uncultured Solobacterium sp.]|jgi:thiamine diphosphokinase|uniref:thiamine diphosphokinase n=1 Tax=uncultured Solobacterium sp. TaxID=747375 RepID=UPI0028D806C8|nr:thiamine diphosphokinase [uncultured Solobacterium sp.]